jgi:hypothetical protein
LELGENKHLYFCVVYLPSPLKIFHLEHFIESSSKALDSKRNVVMLGDFNIREITWVEKADGSLQPTQYDHRIGYTMVDFLSGCNLRQYNHVHNHQNKVLDLILTNTSYDLSVSSCNDAISRVDSYHPPIEIIIKTEKQKLLQIKQLPKRQFYRADYEKIRNQLQCVNWTEELGDCSTVDNAVSKFYEHVNETIEKLVPLKNIGNTNYPSWYSKNLIKILREKEKHRRNMLVHKNNLDKLEYKLLRHRTKYLIKSCHAIYIDKVVKNEIKDPKFFWSYVKNKRSTKSCIPNKIRLGHKVASDGQDITDLFAENFSSVYNTSSTFAPHTNNNIFRVSSSNANLDRVYLSRAKVQKCLINLKVNKSAGSDGIHPVFFKECAKVLAEPLQILYNRSLKEGIFPKQWKEAIIVPIPKSGDKSNVQNYRPISILSVPGKVFECLLCPFIVWHIKQRVSDNQHGFLKNRSTASNMLTFVNRILRELSNGKEVDAIYSDFSKAFDRVDHGLLIHKLGDLYGIHGSLLRWFQSYLTSRTQRVSVNGFLSVEIVPASGVPQGSHLGPILFVAFIDDIKYCIQNSNFELYADDLKLSSTVATYEDQAKVQDDIDRIAVWCHNNNMTLNLDKCYHIKFSRKYKKFDSQYTINNVVLKKVSTVKDLGLVIDSEMRFTNHINTVMSKCLRLSAFIIRNTQDFKSVTAMRILYFALVRSHLDYCNMVWYPYYKNNIQRLETIQKRFVKRMAYLSGNYYNIGSYLKRLEYFKITSLEIRRHHLSLIFLYKIINNLIDCPSILEQLNIRVPRVQARLHNYTPFLTTVSKNRYGSNVPLSYMQTLYNYVYHSVDAIDIFSNRIGTFKGLICTVDFSSNIS